MADYDVLIVGAGPGGYVAAIRAGQLGMRAALVERDRLGGVCLNSGCIPTKALLRNAEVVSLFRRAEEFGVSCDNLHADFGKAVERSRTVVAKLGKGVETLLKKNKVTVIKGTAIVHGNGRATVKETGETLTATSIILATGARPRGLPSLPVDGSSVITSREALELNELPASIAIVGGGPTGCEFASIFAAYGVKVTLIELLPRLLPNEDADVSQAVQRAFARQQTTVLTNTKVAQLKPGRPLNLTLEGPQGASALACDLVLVCAGIQGNVEGIGLEEVGVAVERGFVRVDDQLRTTAANVYAIGDVTGKLPLAHVAMTQGVAVVERLAGREPPLLDYALMPRAVYCSPQVASWGMTEEQARQTGRQIAVGKFPMAASGKAMAMAETQGFAKVVVDKQYGELLGAHLVGAEVTELLAELSLAKMLEGTVREVGWLTHAHPTLSETLKEAALASLGEAIHI
ncbi:MAG: dihydrolipoyl dehydrogenase [Dehalococcoidia bacterium]|nr:dihydrolipoyl dehydrogenase [Dehalococcoidia bacterium]